MIYNLSDLEPLGEEDIPNHIDLGPEGMPYWEWYDSFENQVIDVGPWLKWVEADANFVRKERILAILP